MQLLFLDLFSPLLVDRVSGWDHSALDRVQAGWHENMFPYKLGQYRKKLLTEPSCVAEINYYDTASFCHASEEGTDVDEVDGATRGESTAAAAAAASSRVIVECRKELVAVAAGVCHAIAIWVDYSLQVSPADSSSSGSSNSSSSSSDGSSNFAADCSNPSQLGEASAITLLQSFREGDFPLHHTASVSFLPSPVAVRESISRLDSNVAFVDGDSDFKFEFTWRATE